MKNEYKKKKGETLGKWVERLSQDVLWQRLEPHDIQELLHEVSVTSYIHRTNVTLDILKKEGRL